MNILLGMMLNDGIYCNSLSAYSIYYNNSLAASTIHAIILSKSLSVNLLFLCDLNFISASKVTVENYKTVDIL
jgi:hypothetical protein